MKQEINQNIGFALRKISTEQFAIIEDEFTEGNEVDLKTNVKFGIDTEKRGLSVMSQFTFKNGVSPFLLVEVGCFFEIHEDSWDSFYDSEKDRFVFPRAFISHLVVITIGTTRGVLHSKTEGSKFNGFLLPTINVNELIDNDLIFDFSPSAENEN